MTDTKFQMDELIGKVRAMAAANFDYEKIVQSLFDIGVSKSGAIHALSRGGGMSHGNAMCIVHHSKAYEARKAADAAVHNAVMDVLEDDDLFALLMSGKDDD